MSPELHADIKKSTPFECIEEEVFLNLLRTVNQLHAQPAGLLRDHGLTSQQYNVLRILSGATEGGLTCAEVRERMVTRVPDVTRMVDRLIDSGFVVRERCQSDRRVVRVTVSTEGRRLAHTLAPALVELHQEMMGHLDKTDLLKLNEILNALRRTENQETNGEK